MFGHDANQQQGAAPAVAPDIPDSVLAGIDQATAAAPSAPGFSVAGRPSLLSPAPGAAPASDLPTQAPVASDDIAVPAVSDSGDLDASAIPGISSLGSPSSLTNEDLLAIKQQALQDLSPLVDQLDQTPEEKFRTIMMLIQASDNDGLIKSAFEAAQQITDEKVKAQALLDVVNEINYFTQKEGSGEAAPAA